MLRRERRRRRRRKGIRIEIPPQSRRRLRIPSSRDRGATLRRKNDGGGLECARTKEGESSAPTLTPNILLRRRRHFRTAKFPANPSRGHG